MKPPEASARCALLLGAMLATGASGLAAQHETQERLDMTVGEVAVHCGIGVASGNGTCTVSHPGGGPRLALRAIIRADSIVLQFFAIDGLPSLGSLSVRIDTMLPHSSHDARPFGLTETLAILGEIQTGRWATVEYFSEESGKVSHAILDLGEFREGARDANGFIATLARQAQARNYQPPAIPGAGVHCVDGVAPAGVDTSHHEVSPVGSNMMVLPPLNPPGKLKGKTIKVSVLVGPTGSADSVSILGVADASYLGKMVRSALTFRFIPATLGTCGIASWWSYEVTLGN